MTGSRSILLVEDEPLIAMMLEDLLESLGHRVSCSADGVETAMAHVAAGDFDLAILDVNLRGGEPSWPVADALTARGVPFILATGGGNEVPPERHQGTPTLNKPFTMADVEAAINRL